MVKWHKIGIHVKRHKWNICKFGRNWAYVKLTCNLELGHMLIIVETYMKIYDLVEV